MPPQRRCGLYCGTGGKTSAYRRVTTATGEPPPLAGRFVTLTISRVSVIIFHRRLFHEVSMPVPGIMFLRFAFRSDHLDADRGRRRKIHARGRGAAERALRKSSPCQLGTGK